MSAIEAIYIFNEHNDLILEHVYRGRPPTANVILPLYLAHAPPRPPLIYSPDLSPPTLLYSIIQDRILFIAACSSDGEPLLVLEFLQRVADAFEDFLGSPLLASKIEGSYDVVAQLLEEMCDGGLMATTEPNALRDVVEAPTFMKQLLGGVGLPGAPPSLNPSSTTAFRPQLSRPNSNSSPVPWRRANVRHTSNELYVDIVETLSVIVAPSGRYLSALAAGTVAFTAKVSGVPDMLLLLSAPGGISNTLSLPVFHPCVRLARWKERPGELSFVPPDGRFVLAGYEVDLLAGDPEELPQLTSKQPPNPNLPVMVEIRTGLGAAGTDFEVKMTVSPRFKSLSTSSSASSSSSTAALPRVGVSGRSTSAFTAGGTSAHPSLEELSISVPIPAEVRNVVDLRASRGEAQYAPGDATVEWRLSTKEVSILLGESHGVGGTTTSLVGTIVSANDDEDDVESGLELKDTSWEYNEADEATESYQGSIGGTSSSKQNDSANGEAKRGSASSALMPSSASVSFQIKGWLASGIKVESLTIDQKKSRGLGAGVTPYKGVKYLTVSRNGIDARC